MTTTNRWALKWIADNLLDGHTEFIMGDGDARPMVFRTRKLAREYAQAHFGYIKERKDLRMEPFGWHPIRVVKVSVEVKEIT